MSKKDKKKKKKDKERWQRVLPTASEIEARLLKVGAHKSDLERFCKKKFDRLTFRGVDLIKVDTFFVAWEMRHAWAKDKKKQAKRK